MNRALLLLLFPVTATAQPVIEFANVDLVGKTFAVHLVSDPGASDPTQDGANVTWDFSTATLLLNVGTTTYMDPASTPFAANYPGSDLAQSVTIPTGTTYSYFDLSATELNMLAEGVGGSDMETYSDPKTPLLFPLAYQDLFVDQFTENGTPYSVTRTYVGYGTVITPTATYTNVVKVASSSGSIDFFRSNPVEQLISINSNGQVLVLGDAVTSVDERVAPSLVAWPNPSTGIVVVSGLDRMAIYQLLDAQGRMHRTGNYTQGLLSLDLSGLAQGLYVLKVNDGRTDRSIVLQKH
jgi:hypothetical protein